MLKLQEVGRSRTKDSFIIKCKIVNSKKAGEIILSTLLRQKFYHLGEDLG